MSGKKKNIMVIVLAVCVASGTDRSGLGTVENRNKDNTGGIS